MIKNFLARALPAIALATLPLVASAVPAGAVQATITDAGFARHTRAAAPLLLPEAVERLPLAVEQREGYRRELYRHWNRGLNPIDGCNTRAEVILSEAVVAPTVEPGCKLTGGEWYSYYDDATVTAAGSLDVDHIVPLAEVHDSGGYAWTPTRREAYANDQGSPLTLVAVTARSNRAKADKDPAEWLPPLGGPVHCRYASEWVSTKLRWNLAADQAEHNALTRIAQNCTETEVPYESAP